MQELIADNSITDVQMLTLALNLQLATTLFDALHLSGDARIEQSNFMEYQEAVTEATNYSFPLQYAWRVSAAYDFGFGLVTKVFLGRSYQVPSMTMLYGLAGYGTEGNVVGQRTITSVTEELVPQSVESVELGVSYIRLAKLRLELSAYGQRVSDRIEFMQRTRNFFARNRGQELGLGGELRARYVWGYFAPYMSASAHWSLLQDPDTEAFAPPRGPQRFTRISW